MLALRSLRAAPRAARALSTTAPRLEKAALELALRDGLKGAMKARDKGAVSALKAIIADVTYNVKSSENPNEDASHEVVVTTIRKGIDKRRQAAEAYAPGTPGDHAENFATLNAEIKLLGSFLPVAPTPEAVQAIIDEIVAGLPEDQRKSKSVTGVVIKGLWERLGDARALVDKKDAAKRVSDALKA
ncbi:hypothetical protein Q8F55_004206 [Vanrija albida]|uniref:Altered inheritance of mitochondria protein 41 n=1 Tax=Vanrija albida TaxID=181172 RepID=A0ABR3Q638_9TREE